MREIRRAKKISGIFPVNELDLTDQRVIRTTTRTRGTTGRASRGRDGASNHRRGSTVLCFRSGRKEKTHAVPHEFQGGQRGFREVLKRVFANQRSVTKGRPANAAAAVSQQGRQACLAAAWLVKIFIAILKLSLYPPMSQETADGKSAILPGNKARPV